MLIVWFTVNLKNETPCVSGCELPANQSGMSSGVEAILLHVLVYIFILPIANTCT
ncbi:hypothetical protein PEX1_087850 [Penicillium expansum]|uniref:Uncharacterized protein n=1 Tax=Penicillium expansum TaxID=27334 RepID=A0A0A2K076_PENEN|nr:hypothetical protein PEX2_101860 [Penicillium expansum]KGO43457.1 hypothetical protein PEX1_087850 [Penicillium expansum]KGO46078.1 hypothetical protein PEXP_017200 [Penicillium expansum]KGO61112.1 hypothetical protein PEX2_101860 [Penicillium expansum]